MGMSVMSGRYKHPANNAGYSDKVKGLIDGMLIVEPEKRPDIDRVRFSRHVYSGSGIELIVQVIQMTEAALRGSF